MLELVKNNSTPIPTKMYQILGRSDDWTTGLHMIYDDNGLVDEDGDLYSCDQFSSLEKAEEFARFFFTIDTDITKMHIIEITPNDWKMVKTIVKGE
jgi:hypothetical protein